jgi:hypothetical protein
MADKKVTALTATEAPAAADLAHVITDVATTPTNKKVTLANFFNKIPTFIGLNSVETVTTDTALSLTHAVSLNVQCQTTLADATYTGQIKIIVVTNISSAADVDMTTTLGAQDALATASITVTAAVKAASGYSTRTVTAS